MIPRYPSGLGSSHALSHDSTDQAVARTATVRTRGSSRPGSPRSYQTGCKGKTTRADLDENRTGKPCREPKYHRESLQVLQSVKHPKIPFVHSRDMIKCSAWSLLREKKPTVYLTKTLATAQQRNGRQGKARLLWLPSVTPERARAFSCTCSPHF